jgi:sugar phosphate isomerase/epimerase
MGYDGVELRVAGDGNHFSLDRTAEQRQALRALFANAGTRVFSIGGYTNFAMPDDAQRARNIETLKAEVALAQDLGAAFIRSHVGKIAKDETRAGILDRTARALADCAKVAEKANIHIGLETHDDWCNGSDLKMLIDKVNSPHVGTVFDICNSATGGTEPIKKSFEALKGCIKYCHVKDAAKRPDGKWTSVPPGTGQVPLREVIRMVRASGFDGFLSFEHEKKWEPHLPPPEEAFPHYIRVMRQILSA